MQATAVRPYQKWRWSGDEIVIDPIVPAARKVPGTNKTGYDVDIREYLSTEGNAVLRATLREIVASLSERDRVTFLKRERGAYDFRVRTLLNYVSQLNYIPSKRKADAWFFPEETLANEGGDCEDLAFVLSALLLEADISPYCVRVAFGHFVDHSHGEVNKPKAYDHAWVVYFTEKGAWEILEPLAFVKMNAQRPATKKGRDIKEEAIHAADVEYIPFFVFNRDHLWRVRSNNREAAEDFKDYIDKRFWQGFNPSFAASAHDHIFDEALSDMPWYDLARVKEISLALDVNVLQYDPRDHFDFSYIDESWKKISQNLRKNDLVSFGRAAHTIADFYAHSMYVHFAAPPTGSGKSLPLYDPRNPNIDASRLIYNFNGLDMPGCNKTPEQAARLWRGKLISGQWWRWYTTYPDDLENKKELALHRCLPDHDNLAVDGPKPGKSHRLYVDNTEHERQYNLRRDAAVKHIKQEYNKWRERFQKQ
jgi:hypothetical protein